MDADVCPCIDKDVHAAVRCLPDQLPQILIGRMTSIFPDNATTSFSAATSVELPTSRRSNGAMNGARSRGS